MYCTTYNNTNSHLNQSKAGLKVDMSAALMKTYTVIRYPTDKLAKNKEKN